MTPKRIAVLLLVLLVLVFALQNAQVVDVNFLFWTATASRAVVLLITFVVGLAAGWLLGWRRKPKTAADRR